MGAIFTLDDIFGDSLKLRLDKETESNKTIEVKSTETSKLIKVIDEGVIILSDELRDSVRRKNLSVSMVDKLDKCPADWLMDSFILPKISHTEAIHFARGHMFHKTMERFFKLPNERRNPKTLSQIAFDVMKTQYPTYLEDLETMDWLKKALKNYLDLGFGYKDVEVAEFIHKNRGNPQLGIEIFVDGKLGDTNRKIVGFVDRVDRMEDGRLKVVDYKTGGRIYPFNPEKEISEDNDFGYWRQQITYSMLLEQDGHNVGGASLEFPVAKGIVEVDIHNERLREQVRSDFKRADTLLDEYLDKNLFPFKGHRFCSWCGVLSPNYTIPRFSKLKVSKEELNQYVDFL